MAEVKQKKKSSSPAAQSTAPDVLDKLAEAGESITRISENAKARKLEKAKEMKRSESDAKARREQDREQREAQQKRSDIIAEQKLAAFHYAENYRKKLAKDKEKMVSAAKAREQQARKEAEDRAREERAREIALVREREQAEARARSERAAALLNRVTKCAVVGEDGNVRMVDRVELAKIEAERAAAAAEAERLAREEAEKLEKEEAERLAAEEEIMKNEQAMAYPNKEELVSAIVAAFRQTSPLFNEYENKAREEIAAKRVEEFFVGEMMDTRDGKFVLNIIEDDYTVAITNEDDELIAAPSYENAPEPEAEPEAAPEPETVEESPAEEETAAEPVAEEKAEKEKREYPPVRVSNPVVLELREMAAGVSSKFDLWKYLRRVKKVTKQMHKLLGLSDKPKKGDDKNKAATAGMHPAAIIQDVIMFVDLLNIRCDALSTCVDMKAKKKADEQAQLLYIEIDGYNKEVGNFRMVTGEDLTRVSSFLPEHLLAATGIAVIPAYEFRERYVEVVLNPPKKKTDPYTFVFPSLKDMANGKPVVATPVDPSTHNNENRVTTTALISAPISAAAVYGDEITDVMSYKRCVKQGNKIVKLIDKTILANKDQLEKLGEDQNLARDIVNLEKEKVLVALHRLASSMKTEKVKYTVKAKSYVLDTLREYNRCAKEYAKLVGLDLAKFDMSIPEYVLQTGAVPEIPRFAYCIELFETVGNETRLVGERDADETPEGYTFVFGDYPGAPAQAAEKPRTPEASNEEAPKKKGKKKYMAANDSDTVYLTIPFGESSTDGGTKKTNKKGETVYKPDVPVTLVTSADSAPVNIGATINIVAEREPIPVNVQKDAAKKQPTAEPAPAQPVLTQETIDTLARALSDAVKIAEYAKAAEQYAQNAERAARIAQGLEPAGAVYNNSIYDNTSIPQPIVMETPSRSNAERIRALARNQLASFITNTQKKLSNARREYAKAEALMDAGRPEAKPRLTVECLAPSKAIIDSLSDILAAYSNAMDNDGITRTKRDLLLEVNNYNRLVAQYEKLTGGKLTVASVSMAEDIIAGRIYQSLPSVKFTGRDKDMPNVKTGALAVTESSVPAPSKDMKIINREQLRIYLSDRNRELVKMHRRLAEAERRISSSRDQKRAIAIVDAIIAERDIINELCENLVAACQVSAFSESGKIKKLLKAEIKKYNIFAAELEKTSGDSVTLASEELAQQIISGMEYQPLPEISYSISNPVVSTVDKVNEAIEKGKELYKDEITKEGHLNLASVSAKAAGQANKDVEVISHCAAFEISLLESERDLLRYGYGGEMPRFGKQRKQVARKIAAIKKNHKKAIKFAEADNKRYYQVVMNNPATVETKRKRPNRKKLAALRTRMITLLNERDKINSKLTAIYTGEEYNLDGTGVNQTWRRIKADAIEKEVKRNKYVAREIKHLPASDSEKAQIYELMNQRLDAVSTIALCKYRMKKEYLHEGEWKKLVKDQKEAKKLIKRVDEEIKVLVKRIYKRYKESGIASAWITGMGFFLLFALICVVAYALLFNMDILESIKWIKGFLGL